MIFVGANGTILPIVSPASPVIAERMVQQAEEVAGVVLLHDGGGDRSQTIDALRLAVPALRASGYRFVAMDERAMGVAPRAAARDRLATPPWRGATPAWRARVRLMAP